MSDTKNSNGTGSSGRTARTGRRGALAGAATARQVDDRSDRYLVVGAGPAGLLAARALRHYGIPYDHIERESDVGGIWDVEREWSPMYESAHFISSKQVSYLPGYPMPEDYPDYPNHRQILRYLKDFARDYDLYDRLELDTTLERVERSGDEWVVTVTAGRRGQPQVRRYGGMFLCTGNTWDPNLPHYPGEFDGESMHSVRYRSPEQFAGKRVLVVGGGNSGCDIACDAATHADRAVLSLRRGYHFIPKYIMGQPADVFASKVALPGPVERRVFAALLKLLVGDLAGYGLPQPDHRVMESHPIMNTQVLHHLGHGDLAYRPDVERLEGRTVHFVDGSAEEFDLILYATGYKVTYPFLDPSHFAWVGKYPDLYLSAFHREYDNLCLLGLHQTDGGAYEFFAWQAEVMCQFILDQQREPARAKRFHQRKRSDRPDLSGGLRYVASDRHATYVKKSAFVSYTKGLVKEYGWQTTASYEPPPGHDGEVPGDSEVQGEGEAAGKVAAHQGR